MAKATVGFAQVCNLNEGSLSPDLRQNVICEGKWSWIAWFFMEALCWMIWLPKMRFQTWIFREATVTNQEETVIDDLPLHQDSPSPVSVGENSLLLMAFAVRHKHSQIALEDLLELIHFHCPRRNNNCITELKEFLLKHPVLKYFYCPDVICNLCIGTTQPESGDNCAVCGTPLNCSSYFIEIAIMEQLKTHF